jgi:hypothetical protein
MSRSLNYLTLTFFVVLVGLSCGVDKKEQRLSDYNVIKPVFELALSEFNANKLAHERGLLLKGSVDISQEENQINILFEENNQEVFKLFYLQVKEGLSAIDELFIGDASILYLRRGLVVHDNSSGENYIFSLQDFDVRSNSHLAPLDFIAESGGYGLGLMDNIDPSLKLDCRCTCEDALVVDPEPCDAGGPGSSQCSKGDCTVSCNSGFYSCCNC